MLPRGQLDNLPSAIEFVSLHLSLGCLKRSGMLHCSGSHSSLGCLECLGQAGRGGEGVAGADEGEGAGGSE